MNQRSIDLSRGALFPRVQGRERGSLRTRVRETTLKESFLRPLEVFRRFGILGGAPPID